MGLTIGVDVGGTKIAAGVVDETGTILARTRVPTPADPQWAVGAIADAVKELRAEYNVTAVGVGAPGYIDRNRSTVIMAPNINWENEPLKARIEDLVDLPTVIENDANAAAWGEFRFGAAVAHEDMIMITVGTGIGGGIVIDGRMHRGSFGVAGEIGHLNMVPDGLPCGCGGKGCWEQYASGRALRRYGRDRAANEPVHRQPDHAGRGRGRPARAGGLRRAGRLARTRYGRPGVAVRPGGFRPRRRGVRLGRAAARAGGQGIREVSDRRGAPAACRGRPGGPRLGRRDRRRGRPGPAALTAPTAR
jgi:predicted NBD/HSP70 family sugar kinase